MSPSSSRLARQPIAIFSVALVAFGVVTSCRPINRVTRAQPTLRAPM